MMLEVGKTFVKNGNTFCLLKLINYNNEKFAIFSVENEEISFKIYKVIENSDSYNLLVVDNDELKFTLLEMFESEEV